MVLFQSDQREESRIVTDPCGPYRIRHVYARSRETQEHQDMGQDYMTYKAVGNKLMFCVCDGVSLSYYGNLAAKFLGDSLLRFMANSDCFDQLDMGYTQQRLHQYLQLLTLQASALICNHQVPPHITGIMREVLEEKRVAGSESTFACGKIILSPDRTRVQIVVAWLGDTSVRIWHNGEQHAKRLAGDYSMWNRWSTLRGVLGQPSCQYAASTADQHDVVNRIQIYTDGLHAYESWNRVPDDRELRELVDQAYLRPDSDDVAYLDITW